MLHLRKNQKLGSGGRNYKNIRKKMQDGRNMTERISDHNKCDE